VRVYAVVSDRTSDEALELFVDRQMAELMVENWDRDEPDRAGRAQDLVELARTESFPVVGRGTKVTRPERRPGEAGHLWLNVLPVGVALRPRSQGVLRTSRAGRRVCGKHPPALHQGRVS
jgi:hypothetical protein